jgi:hypothetical protein
MPDELLTAVYDALFARNPQIKPEMIDATFIGTSSQTALHTTWAAWPGWPEDILIPLPAIPLPGMSFGDGCCGACRPGDYGW